MDKWFILQATSPAANVLETVRGLLQHRSFTMSNPNRIRSLIGAFAGSTRQRSMPKMAAVTSSWWKCLPTSTAVTRR